MADFDLVDDFEQYRVTRVEDLPKMEERDYAKSKSVLDMPSEVTNKAITCKIQDYEIRKGGFMQSDIVNYQVVTEEPGQLFKLRVHRNDNDFFELRRLLVQAVPYIMVPPLPKKSSST
jgi:hypothetical protein